MKRIMIALDYNPTAEKIAEQGFSLAKNMNAQVILLHVVSADKYYADIDYSPIMGFYGDKYFKNPTTFDMLPAAQHFLNSTKEHLGDITIETIVKQGDFAEIILQTAQIQEIDIIVMGSHSRRWLEKVLMGSVTEKVLSETTIPMLIVPTKK